MQTQTYTKFKLYIDGQLSDPHSLQFFDSINPSNGQICAQIADADTADMKQAIRSARQAFDEGEWSGLSIMERGIYLKRLAKLIRENAKELASLETQDTGKTSKQTTFIDVPTCAETFEYFGGISDALNDRENQLNAPVKSITAHEPMGVVGCIIPWNYPLIMAAWKLAPALIAGNTVVFKPSRLGSVSIAKLAQLCHETGFPQGVVNIVTSTDHEVVRSMVESPEVNMISFTGGTETGRAIMTMAAKTPKKVGLELGGKSPNIVFADCDQEAALGGSLSAIFMNQGQMCTAGSRLLIEDSIYDEFLNKIVNKTKNLKIGPAESMTTAFGPLISKQHRDHVLQAIEKAKKEGATVVCGGHIPEIDGYADGFYIEPTILTDVTNSMPVAQEEIFGPVLCVMTFKSEEEAIAMANDTKYGLASCLWTKDKEKASRVAAQIKAGTVWINTYGGFYNEAPIGGYKHSGFGRELGPEGLLEYTQTKHICMDETPGGKPLVSTWF